MKFSKKLSMQNQTTDGRFSVRAGLLLNATLCQEYGGIEYTVAKLTGGAG
jgi:hypothetical protein